MRDTRLHRLTILDLIVTFSELLSPEIQQNLIKIDRTRSSAGLYTVRLIDEKDMCRYHVVVKADWKYAVSLWLIPT